MTPASLASGMKVMKNENARTWPGTLHMTSGIYQTYIGIVFDVFGGILDDFMKVDFFHDFP